MGDRLATINMDMGRKLDCAPPPFFLGGGELGPHLAECRLCRGLPPYQHKRRAVRLRDLFEVTDDARGEQSISDDVRELLTVVIYASHE